MNKHTKKIVPGGTAMKKSTFTILTILILAGMVLSACQARPASAAIVPTSQAESILIPTAVAPAPTQPPVPTQEPTAAPTPNPDPAQPQDAEASAAAQAYFDAISSGDTQKAADLLSSFSLMVFESTRGDAVTALQKEKIDGMRWSNLQTQGTQAFDSQTILVHVTYSVSQKDPAAASATPAATAVKTTTATSAAKTATTTAPTKTVSIPAPTTAPVDTRDELWPFRLEYGSWHYNWKNLIDFRSMNATAQTMNGITLMPLQLNRYSDRLQLTLLVQNRTNEAVVFGQANETLGTFHFGDQSVLAEKAQWILNPLRSVPAAALEAKGLFSTYPDTIEIRKWNNFNVKPWYVFQLQ
jgi:hypothetical protein